MKQFNKFMDILSQVEKWLCIIALTMMFLIGALEVVSRNLFSKSFIWSQELIVVFLVWEVFMAGAYIYNTGNLISVDFLYEHMTPRGKAVLDVLIDLVTCVVLAVIIYFGWQYQVVQGKFLTNALRIPNNIHSIPLIICGVSMLLRLIQKYLSRILKSGEAGSK